MKNPYVGPRPFVRGERLYGRDAELAELRDLLLSHRVVVLHSPSGAGKTSLVAAGLAPALEREGYAVTPRLLVGTPPPISGGAAPNRYAASAAACLAPERAGAGFGPPPLAEALAEWRAARAAATEEEAVGAVLVLDQFEEILTLDPTDEAAKAAFFAELGRLVRDPRWLAVLVIREEFLGALDPFARMLPGALRVRFRLDLLGERAAVEAVQRPARDEGTCVDDEAARRLVEDLRAARVQRPDGTWVTEPGPHVDPMQLQVVCRRLWDESRPDAARITIDDVARLGRIDDALARHCDGEFAAIAQATGSPERIVRTWIERELVTPGGLRGQVMKEPIATRGLPNTALKALEDAHLVRVDRRRGTDWIEPSHDRLIEPLRASNRAWLDAHLTPFQQRVRAWSAQGEAEALLSSGAELEEALRRRASGAEFTQEEHAYLEASEAVASRSARSLERGTALDQLGWAVLFAAEAGEDPPERAALRELLEHRRREAGRVRAERYREFVGEAGYRAGEAVQEFLARHGAGTMRASADAVPYYVLVVGSPTAIPFSFQTGLDVQYAVGRVSFDALDAYAAYARTVVASETGGFVVPRRASLFCPIHETDTLMTQALRSVVAPTAERLATARRDWGIDPVLGLSATKSALRDRLGGPATPAVLLTVAHGMAFAQDDPRWATLGGAIVCADWQGAVPVGREHCLAGEDLAGVPGARGLVAVVFGHSSAGRSELDRSYWVLSRGKGSPTRAAPLVSALPSRLLARDGGALAVIGHVDAAWASSVEKAEAGVFQDVLARLMDGHTVGSAMEPFNERYAALSARLSEVVEAFVLGETESRADLERPMIASMDARNYVLIGDPAARLPLAPA